MTRETKDLRNDLLAVVRLIDKGQLDDMPAATYKKLRSTTTGVLRWHDKNHGVEVAWGFVLVVGVLVFLVAVQVGLP
jgi:hypothetical protein